MPPPSRSTRHHSRKPSRLLPQSRRPLPSAGAPQTAPPLSRSRPPHRAHADDHRLGGLGRERLDLDVLQEVGVRPSELLLELRIPVSARAEHVRGRARARARAHAELIIWERFAYHSALVVCSSWARVRVRVGVRVRVRVSAHHSALVVCSSCRASASAWLMVTAASRSAVAEMSAISASVCDCEMSTSLSTRVTCAPPRGTAERQPRGTAERPPRGSARTRSAVALSGARSTECPLGGEHRVRWLCTRRASHQHAISMPSVCNWRVGVMGAARGSRRACTTWSPHSHAIRVINE